MEEEKEKTRYEYNKEILASVGKMQIGLNNNAITLVTCAMDALRVANNLIREEDKKKKVIK